MSHGETIAATQQHGPPHVWVMGAMAIVIVAWLVYRAAVKRKQ